MKCGVRKQTLKQQREIFKNILARVVCFPTRQAGCGVHPLQQLSHTQLPTVVGVTWQHNLTHLHLSGVSVPFLSPLDEDRALHRVWFIFRCHNSAAYGKCKIVKAWFQVSEMTFYIHKHALTLWIRGTNQRKVWNIQALTLFKKKSVFNKAKQWSDQLLVKASQG